MTKIYSLLFFIIILLFSQCSPSEPSKVSFAKTVSHKINSSAVTDLKITTLSTMLANQGIGEWGYSALVIVDGNKILFDTGRFFDTVLKNAEDLGIDLSTVEHVFLSHNHGDHTGGLVALRQTLKELNPNAISKIHVGEGIFHQRINFPNRMLEMKEELEADGVKFYVYEKEFELFPGVWITGPIPRIHPEKNYGGQQKIATESGSIIDNIPEDQSLAIHTDKGFVVIAGCGHAGLINTLDHVQTSIHKKNIHAIIGGFHLVNATDKELAWTAKHLDRFRVEKIIGAHCTGINSLFTLKNLLGLKRADAVVGSVGDHFDLVSGINPGVIAR